MKSRKSLSANVIDSLIDYAWIPNNEAKKIFTVKFKDYNIGVEVRRNNLEEVYHSFICDIYEEIGIEPDFITLPSNIEISYHNYYFHKVYDHGTVDEKQMISDLIIINN